MTEENESAPIKIMFVDDEEKVLEGIMRSLIDMEDEWEMEFINNGQKALELMEKSPFDVIVSDMRMPEMDGATLLNTIKEKYPKTIRFILSGYSDQDMIMKTVSAADQFITKPCEPELLISIIKTAMESAKEVSSDKIDAIVHNVDSLPTLPDIYIRVKESLQSENTSLADVAKIIQQDVSISAKILQVVNSAFFGLRREIRDLQQAVVYLGAETIKSLIIMTDTFDQFSDEEVEKFSIQNIFNHCILVGSLSSKIMKSKKNEKELIERAMMAGMLHDIGKLVFIRSKPGEYFELFKKQKESKELFDKLEKEIFQVTHAEIGGFLLGKWGLPDPVVKAVRYHHNSIKAFENDFDVTQAVFVANTLVHSVTDEKKGKKPHEDEIKQENMTKGDLLKLLPEWKSLAEELIATTGGNS